MNMDEELDLSMRAPYIPMNEADDLPLLLSEDLMWGAFPDSLGLHKDIKLINQTNEALKNEKMIDSSLAALLCGGEPQPNNHNNNNNNNTNGQEQNHQIPIQQQQIQHSQLQQQQQHHQQHQQQQQQIQQHHQNDTRKSNLIDHCIVGNLVNPNDVLEQVFNKSCKYSLCLYPPVFVVNTHTHIQFYGKTCAFIFFVTNQRII